MIDPITIIVAQRAAERTIIALFAGTSLILGYRLFKLGIVVQQKGEMGWGNLKVKLLSVGPGVFFALFGTVVFGILAFRPINIRPEEVQGGPDAKRTQTISYGVRGESMKVASISDEDSLAITTVLDLLNGHELTPALNNSQKESLQKGIKGLELLRKSAAYGRYPLAAPNYEEWSQKSSLDEKFTATLTEGQRKQFEEMNAFLKNSYIGGSQP